MLRKINSLYRFKIYANDGRSGHIVEFLCNDEEWQIHHLVVNIGTWLFPQNVMVALEDITCIEWENREGFLRLSKVQLEQCPAIEAHRPATRRPQLPNYLRGYWSEAPLVVFEWMLPRTPDQATEKQCRSEDEQPECYMVSTKDILRYKFQTRDGIVGFIKNLIVDDSNWQIKYMVAETKSWWSKKYTLFLPQWIRKSNWTSRNIKVDVNYQTLLHIAKNSLTQLLTTKIENKAVSCGV